MTEESGVSRHRHTRMLGILIIGTIGIVDMACQEGRCTVYAITCIALIAGVDIVTYIRRVCPDLFRNIK